MCARVLFALENQGTNPREKRFFSPIQNFSYRVKVSVLARGQFNLESINLFRYYFRVFAINKYIFYIRYPVDGACLRPRKGFIFAQKMFTPVTVVGWLHRGRRSYDISTIEWAPKTKIRSRKGEERNRDRFPLHRKNSGSLSNTIRYNKISI